MEKIDEDIAIKIFCEVAEWYDVSRVEAIDQGDRYLVSLKGGYGKRSYEHEVEVFFDGRVLFWVDKRPKDVSTHCAQYFN